jgi:hypothetical protein
MRINIIAHDGRMVKRRGQGTAVYFDNLSIYSKFLEISSYSIVGYLHLKAEVGANNLIVKVHLVKNKSLPLLFEHFSNRSVKIRHKSADFRKIFLQNFCNIQQGNYIIQKTSGLADPKSNRNFICKAV